MTKNSIIPFQFGSTSIRVVTDKNGEPLFVGKDICDALGFTNHNKAMGDHCKGVTIRYPLQTEGGKQLLRVLPEPDVLRLIVNSTLPAADAFERLVFEEILPTIRKTGSYTAPSAAPTATKRYIDAATAFIRNAAIDLKMAQSSVLGMYQKLEDKVGLTGLLPHYAVDAPVSAIAGSSEVTLPASALLKQRGVDMGAPTFNKLLMKHGFLEERERPSTHGVSKFKVITDLEYGKNLTSPANPRETQPHWYVNKFDELLSLVLTEGVTV